MCQAQSPNKHDCHNNLSVCLSVSNTMNPGGNTCWTYSLLKKSVKQADILPLLSRR
jgi:hypothetical protein